MVNSSSRVAVFHAPGEPFEMCSVQLPAVGEHEALVRVTCCTICGSDLHTYGGRRSTPTPTILGHEILGEVVALGADSPSTTCDGSPVRIGDRITWSIAASCGSCAFCNWGLPQKCEHLFKYGHERIDGQNTLSGGLAQYCVLRRGTAIVKVPSELDDRVACPANCATATVAAILRSAELCEGEVVLVQGTGMLGLTACAMARSSGAREVIACDVDAVRLARATTFGATRTALIESGDDPLGRAVDEATVGRGVDVAIEVSGSPAAMESGLAHLRVGGRYIWAGAVCPDRPVEISAETVVRRLTTIRGVHNYTPDDLKTAVRFLQDNAGRYPFDSLVSRSFALSRVQSAFEHAIGERPLRVAVVPDGAKSTT